MATSKRVYQNIGRFYIYLYLILFPFGQILKLGTSVNLGNLTDVLVLLSIPFYFLKNIVLPKFDRYVRIFFVYALFSLVFSLIFFNFVSVVYGSFYLIRIFAYYSFGVLVFNLTKQKVISSKNILTLLSVITLVVAIIGWYQYFKYPDVRFLRNINWDDHFFRLVGSFLDPAFTGIILTLGTLVSYHLWYKRKEIIFLLICLFLSISVFFTYSRASYLALLVGMFFAISKFKIIKRLFVLIVVFLGFILLLPRHNSEGTLLERTASIYNRIGNYSQTIHIIKHNPLFGVGLNNLCSEKIKLFGDIPTSHSCSGSDSSLLFILSTTGLVGLLILIALGAQIYVLNNSLFKKPLVLSFELSSIINISSQNESELMQLSIFSSSFLVKIIALIMFLL